uniref:Uncharacterized protein n=1 Tax=Oryza glaberrima TaxID=4538 RepID=I1Q286_ORYGL
MATSLGRCRAATLPLLDRTLQVKTESSWTGNGDVFDAMAFLKALSRSGGRLSASVFFNVLCEELQLVVAVPVGKSGTYAGFPSGTEEAAHILEIKGASSKTMTFEAPGIPKKRHRVASLHPAQNTSKNIKNIQEHINMNIKNILPNHREPSKLLIPIKNTITKYTSRTDR